MLMTKKKSKDTAKQADAAKQADTAKQTDTFVVELGLSVEKHLTYNFTAITAL